MADFLELVESLQSDAASARKLFESEGQGVRHISGTNSPEYMSRLAEAARFVAEVYRGKRSVAQLKEAMTTSDFPILFGDILDRQVLAAYREAPSTYRQWCRTKTVRDFREVKRRYVDGGDGTLGKVTETGEYPEVSRSEGEYGYRVHKYGAKFDLSWESLINDDLDMLKDQPERFGRAARRTEERQATSLIVGATGYDSTFFSAANKNLLTGADSALSVASLTAMFNLFGHQVDDDGEPILNAAAILMVPPALEITALQILNALEYSVASGGTGTTEQAGMKIANWIKNKLQLVVNHYLPIIDLANGDTAWYGFANPSDGRGAVEVAHLVGHEEPEIFMKAPDSIRVGGGAAGAMDGDFGTDAVQYKVRHVFGGGQLDPKYAVASKGKV